ncbi:OmpA family protein [Sphingomonas sp. HF-S3]|uniref:OmpA family protein n=1 Tax=Sphingomonas rustica TaxID=3103142 RepID=A0ABV0BHB1_9SPHN
MRIAILSSAAVFCVALVTPAAAQSQAEPSVERYLCTFAGKCDGVSQPEEATPTRAAPAVKGFRLARAKSDATASAAARPAPRPAARTYSAPSRNAVAARGARTRSGYGAAGSRAVADAPRADLMIGFELNSARLTSDGVAKGQIFAQSLLRPELRDKRFLIEGHTDARGGIPLNMDLSRRRAEVVAQFLESQGVERSRIEVRGFGPNEPLPGRNAYDPRNRRVEARLIS